MMQILKRGFTLTQGGYPLWGERRCCKKRVYFEEESFLYLRSGSWNKYKVKRLWYICMVTPPRTPRQRKSSANCLLKRISSANCLLKNIYHNTYLLDNPSHNASDLQIAFPTKAKNQNKKKQNKNNKENWLIRDPETKTKTKNNKTRKKQNQTKTKKIDSSETPKPKPNRYTKQSRIGIQNRVV